MLKKFLTAAEARAMLEWNDRRNGEFRAKAPPGCADLYARLFPPLSDEIFRLAMEKALLGKLPDPRELPPLAARPDDDEDN